MGVLNNLNGMTFYRLSVIKRDDNYISSSGKSYVKWLCLCNCENKTIVSVFSNSLLSGHTKSCGCINKEKARSVGKTRLIDLKGKRFGRLLVESISKTTKNGAFWLCHCDCKNTKIIWGDNLRRGLIKSCGCLSESWIASELKKYFLNNYNSKSEYKAVKNPKTNQYLRYDLYLVDYNTFIEIHGQQHYKLNQWHVRTSVKNNTTPEEEFKYQKKKDRIKRNFAKQNGTYIEINLNKETDIANIIKRIENILKKQEIN